MSPEFIARHWYRLSPLSLLALPLSLLFRLAVSVRRQMYRAGILGSVRLPVPVLVVGNLTVGGTGKTPLVIWIASMLAQAGWRPGVLSRGYGGAADAPREVRPGDEASVCGDEPVLLAARCPCPVWIGRDRAKAGAALLAAHPDCNVLVCDDGLQHYRLARDIEIAVVDGRGNGNGLMLPAGPLREPADRPVDALASNGDSVDRSRCGRVAVHGGSYAMRLEPLGCYPLHDPEQPIAVSELADRRLHAVAAIGDPQRFFDLLSNLGLMPNCHAFPDHHSFVKSDLEFPDCDLVLMTEKDAVKCGHLGRVDLVALRVEAKLDPSFGDFILGKLRGPAPA